MPPKWWYHASPTPPARHTFPSYSPPSKPPVFGWLLCGYLSCFIVPFAVPNETTASHPALPDQCASSPASNLSWKPIISWLLRVFVDWQPPKAKALPSSLFFDGACVGSSNKGTNHGAAKPNRARLEPAYGKQWRHELPAPLLYPWRERAKPLEGRAMEAHFGVVYCVVFVCCCLHI